MRPTDRDTVERFIREVYSGEDRPVMKQGIAYGAAYLQIFDIALEFARRIYPGSLEDKVNRSWTLVFYGDMPKEDPLRFLDDGRAPWERSRAARIRRIKGNREKDRAFRMFDLRILYTFFVSRGWKDLSQEELQVIRGCEAEIPGYPAEVTEFLKRAKRELIEEYEKHLSCSD